MDTANPAANHGLVAPEPFKDEAERFDYQRFHLDALDTLTRVKMGDPIVIRKVPSKGEDSEELIVQFISMEQVQYTMQVRTMENVVLTIGCEHFKEVYNGGALPNPSNPAIALLSAREAHRIGVIIQSTRATCAASIGPAKVEQEMYCTFCGKVLMVIPAGSQRTLEVTNICDCSWNCCYQSSAPHHPAHLAFRDKEVVNGN